MPEISIPLTEAQQRHLKPLVAQVESVRRQIDAFTSYVADEAKAAPLVAGQRWKLKITEEGQASLVGMVEG